MYAPLLILSLFLPASSNQECPDLASCRQAALDAQLGGDYEKFHDLAWRAAQKGRANDPELLTLVARAQSLSGRPGDAIVMLRRLAQMGVATDAATSDDFRRVRAQPGWPELEAVITSGIPLEPPSAPTRAATPASAAEKGTAKVAANESTPAADAELLPEDFAAVRPAGLAYDAVSKRFIVGDRGDNRLIVYDDVFKRATNMVGADSAGFFGLTAVEIDPRRGDLWVANSSAVRGAALHKLQLVSGRVLFELNVPAEMGPTTFVDAAVLPDGQVLVLDAQGRRLLSVSPSRRAFVRVATVDIEAPTSVVSIDGKNAYIAHLTGILRVDLASRAATAVRGAPADLLRIRGDRRALIGVQASAEGQRIVRLRLDSQGKRITGVEVLEQSLAMPDAAGMTVDDGVVSYIESVNGVGMIRRIRIPNR